MNKVVLHLQGFYKYCVEQITMLKLKISNKIHHIKPINEINENIHIEETKDALILVDTGIARFRTKLFIRIVVILKKFFVAVEKAKKRVCAKVSAFKEKSKKRTGTKLLKSQKTKKRNRPKITKKKNRPQIAQRNIKANT